MTEATYLSWVRGGLASSADATDTQAVQFSAVFDTDKGQQRFQGPLRRLLLPGDITGISEDAVRARYPAADSVGTTAGNLAYVEFSIPGLPWALSPKPTQQGAIPSLTLLCIPQSMVTINYAGKPLPTISFIEDS